MLAAWETIRKFVLERGRDFRQRRRRVVEEDSFDQPPSNSDVPLQFAEPQFEEPSGVAVQGKVKWFNPSKGYGFVELSEGSSDAFLHASVLGRIGISAVQPGETLELRVAPGQRGPQVTEGHRQLVGSGQPDLGGWKMSQGLTLPNAADFRPEVEALAPGSSVLGGSDMAAADIKQVIDLIVG